MDSLTIRVSRASHTLLRELSAKSGDSMTEIVDRAVKDYQRRQFWEEYHAAYAALRADPAAWANFNAEAEAWDVTLADGLEDWPNEVGGEQTPHAG